LRRFYLKKSVKLKGGDKIIAGPSSYVTDLWNEPGPTQTRTGITMFPNSELELDLNKIKGVINARI
jgi:hypothetical protein